MPPQTAGDVTREETQRLARFSAHTERKTSVPQDDSWLNDSGMVHAAIHAQTAARGATIAVQNVPQPAPQVPRAVLPAIDCTPFSPRRGHIGRGSPLWPVMMHLSENIWQKLFRAPDGHTPIAAGEAHSIDAVRRHALDMLIKEPALAEQIRGLAEAEQVFRCVEVEVLGYGPLETLLEDEAVSLITVVGPRSIYVERNGRMIDVDPAACSFEDERHMLRILENMLRQAGQPYAIERHMFEARLPGGPRVNAILPPLAREMTLTIRTGARKLYSLDDLVRLGMLSQKMADFLRACVAASLNIVICGEGGSGRTTLLNALGACIPAAERIVTIEDAGELQFPQKHVVSLLSQWACGRSAEHVTKRDLVSSALRLHPQRIVLDDCQGDEAAELLQAAGNGYGGLLLTLFANNVRTCLSQLETLCLAGGMDPPLSVLRRQMATGLNLLIQVVRLRDGAYKVRNIAEVVDVHNDCIRLQSIFHYRESGMDVKEGNMTGAFEPGGFSPTFLPLLEALDSPLSAEMFAARAM